MAVMFDRKRGGYVVNLTDAERKGLAWIADRYVSAATLFDQSEWEPQIDGEGWDMIVPEPVAWQYLEELPAENGEPDAILPPCAGGTLADKLIALWEAIV